MFVSGVYSLVSMVTYLLLQSAAEVSESSAHVRGVNAHPRTHRVEVDPFVTFNSECRVRHPVRTQTSFG